MKVIFTSSVAGVAGRGDVKNVKRGFFRNYLLPYKKAILATDGGLKQWEELRTKVLIEREELKSKLSEIKTRIEGLKKVTIEKKITKKGTLYSSVKEKEIVLALKEQANIDVSETAVKVGDSIKAAGSYNVKLDFGEGVTTILPIEVVAKK